MTSTVALTDGTREWRTTLVSETSTPTLGAPGTPDATVRGSAPALLLALSGRDLEGIGPARFGVEALARSRATSGLRAAADPRSGGF